MKNNTVKIPCFHVRWQQAQSKNLNKGGSDLRKRRGAAPPLIPASCGLILALQAVPDDVELVGFGDEAISMFSKPKLTYLKRPVREMAEKATSILLEWIEGKNGYGPLQKRSKTFN